MCVIGDFVIEIRKKILTLLVFGLFIATPFVIQGADLNHNKYPKLANLFFRWDIKADEAKALAKWDVLIIDMEVQTYSPNSLKLIKKLNPKTKLLAYIASEELRGDSGSLAGTLRQKLYQRIDPSWWLRDIKGNQVAWWAPNPMINVTAKAPIKNGQSWSDVLTSFVKTELIDSGNWDGVFYDNVWDNISFMESFQLDLNQDGIAEPMVEINNEWRAGMTQLLAKTRSALGADTLIMGNGGDYYYQYLNGVLYEHFPAKGWAETLKKYAFVNASGVQPSLSVLNVNVNNTGNNKDYQKLRFGLASALLGDGYYSFDNGDASHHEVWWYDEYEAFLGVPAGEAVNVHNNSKTFSEGLWRRDFKNGLVLVNSSGKNYDLELGGEYEKLHGGQDPAVNDGVFTSAVEVPAKDGLVLLRPIENIYNATYVNGSFARVFNGYGHVARTGFFAYNEKFKGSSQIIEQDINLDGAKETLVADNNQVKIFNSAGQLTASFYPYTEKYNNGVNITVGDLDKNGTLEIVTGTEKGGGPHIRIFNSEGKLINPGFFAYGPEFRGGVNVTIADLEGDGWYEIVAGAGYGGGPHVRVFAPDGRCINPGFFAYDSKFRGGVNVAAGDLNGDGIDEIITGAGKGGGPRVRVFDKNGKVDGPDFFAFDSALRDGVKVAASDLDGDGRDEIIATTTNVFTLAGF